MVLVRFTEASRREKQRIMMGYERGNESMEGPATLAYSAGPFPLVCSLFFSLFSFLSSWSLLFPLSIAFLTVLSSCQRTESESPLSQPVHFSFVLFCLSLPLSTHGLVCTLVCTLHPYSTQLCSPPPLAYDVTPGAKAIGKWPKVAWARVQQAFLGVVNYSFFPLRRVLPLFGKSVSCFKKTVLPFKEFQCGSLSPYFSSKLIWCVCTCQLSCYRACYLYQ